MAVGRSGSTTTLSMTKRSVPSGLVRVAVAVPFHATVGVNANAKCPDRSISEGLLFSMVAPPTPQV